jgi:hypothetical protein
MEREMSDESFFDKSDTSQKRLNNTTGGFSLMQENSRFHRPAA